MAATPPRGAPIKATRLTARYFRLALIAHVRLFALSTGRRCVGLPASRKKALTHLFVAHVFREARNLRRRRARNAQSHSHDKQRQAYHAISA
jgi:hypothetical protein